MNGYNVLVLTVRRPIMDRIAESGGRSDTNVKPGGYITYSKRGGGTLGGKFPSKVAAYGLNTRFQSP